MDGSEKKIMETNDKEVKVRRGTKEPEPSKTNKKIHSARLYRLDY